jgi:hypothetical protein
MAPVKTRKRKPTGSFNKTLTQSDYIKILKYYKMRIPNSAKTVKRDAEKMLATKLCRCIKKVGVGNEPATIGEQRAIGEPVAIGICTRSVINRKGLRRGSFKCAKKRISLFKRGK